VPWLRRRRRCQVARWRLMIRSVRTLRADRIGSSCPGFRASRHSTRRNPGASASLPRFSALACAAPRCRCCCPDRDELFGPRATVVDHGRAIRDHKWHALGLSAKRAEHAERGWSRCHHLRGAVRNHRDPIGWSRMAQISHPRTYWLNHSMVRVHACWAVTLL
jgi:hypothetical protein